MGRFLSGCLLAAGFAAAPVGAQTIVRDAAELLEAFDNGAEEIEVRGLIELGPPSDGSPNALPALQGGRSLVLRGQGSAELRASGAGYRLLKVNQFASLSMDGLRVVGFSSNEPGGAIHIEDAFTRISNVTFRDNRSTGNGGALVVQGDDARVQVTDVRFENNVADERGGAVYLRNTVSGIRFERVQFVNNQAVHGCAAALRGSFGAVFRSSVFRGACGTALVYATLGLQGHHFVGNTWVAQGSWAFRFRAKTEDDPRENIFIGNVLVQAQDDGLDLCRQVEGNAAESPFLGSRGHNVTTDESCGLEQETDMIASGAGDVLASPPDPGLLASGPAVDVIEPPTVGQESGSYLCGISDIRGLGRPQDGDGDGVPACDLGAIERQRGPDIGAAQSGAYYDPARPGEGYFLEVLENGRAWVTFFSFAPQVGSPPTPKQPAWYFGLGRVVGNSVVVPDFSRSFGGRFGDEFDPDEISTSSIGGLSLVFPGCEASGAQPGNSFLRGDSQFNIPGQFFLNTRAVRLSRIVECGQESQEFPSGLSGNFFDPERSGEGIGVQWLPDGRVLVIWYTFAPNGQPLWLISESADVDGNTVSASMVYPAQSTGFGHNFDPEEIELEPWGTLTLQYTDCDTIEFGFDSEIQGFGSGSFTYQRLTQLAGTTCEL